MNYYVNNVVVDCDTNGGITAWPQRPGRLYGTRVGDCEVSTAFLGLASGYEVLAYETMVFGGPLDGEFTRCGDFSDARRMHGAMVDRVQRSMRVPLTWSLLRRGQR